MTLDLIQEHQAMWARHMAEVIDTAYFIAELSDPAQELDGVYNQFKMFRIAPNDYHLPEQYFWAESVICGFDDDDYEGFLEFARTVAQQFPKRSEDRRPVQAVFRKINCWADACRRRELISRIDHGYQVTHGYLPAGQVKRDYIETLLRKWREERQEGLSALSHYDKASHGERVQFLRNFWRTKSEEAWNGKIPHWKELLAEPSDHTPAVDDFEDEDESIIEEPEALSERDELQIFAGRAEARQDCH